MTTRSVQDLVRAWASIFKSVPTEQLEDLRTVEDLWNEPGGQFASPSRSEIKTGTPQAASGGGAERMVREYSDPAPQMGMTEKYAEFSGMLRDFGKSLSDVAGATRNNHAQIQALVQLYREGSTTTKATPTAKAPNPESALAKAELKLKKARAELRKADMSDDEDKDEREEKKSYLTEAALALKSAKKLLAKAEDEEDSEESEERAEKARSDFFKLSKAVKKAEDEGTKREEDETKREDAEKARKVADATAKADADAAAAKKAADDAAALAATAAKAEHGGEAPEEKKDDEKAEKARQAEAAKSSATVDSSVRDQINLLNTTVKGLMETVMAGSKHGPAPVFVKAAQLPALSAKIDAAIEDGTLESPTEIMKAHTLVTHIRAVQDGTMEAAIVEDEIARAPDNVRTLFRPEQAAA